MNEPFQVALIGHSDPTLPAWLSPRLRAAGIDFVHAQCDSPQEIVSLAGRAQVLWTFGSNPRFSAPAWCELIRQALPGLDACRAILRSGSGTDNVPVAEAMDRGILVANTPTATAEPVAEYTVGLMLAVARHIVADARRATRGDWSQPALPTAVSLADRTVGLIGFGHIARGVARRLGGFGVRLLASDPAVPAEVMSELGTEKVAFDKLLAQSTVVSLHCPLTPGTRGLIGRDQLGRMPRGAILINTARGELIDEAALLAALESGHLAGAGLDVLGQEPPPADHPLLHLPQVVVTPHMAAFSEQIFTEMWRLSVETLLALAAGQLPASCVNAEALGLAGSLRAS